MSKQNNSENENKLCALCQCEKGIHKIYSNDHFEPSEVSYLCNMCFMEYELQKINDDNYQCESFTEFERMYGNKY